MIPRSAAVRRGFGLALAAVLVTSGCAAGRDAQTQNQVPSQDGTNADAGTMALRGIALSAPSSGTFYAAGSTIPMRLVLVNNGTKTDQLVSITTSSATGWASYRSKAAAQAAALSASASPSSSTSSPSASSSSTSSATTSSQSPVSVPAGQRVSWNVPDSRRVLVLLGSVGRVYPGSSVKITFTFSRAGSVTADVPVQLSSSTPTASIGASNAG